MIWRWLALCGLLAACGDARTVVVVTLAVRPATQDADTLQIQVSGGASDSRSRSYSVAGRDFPLTLTVTPDSTRGPIFITATLLSRDTVVAAGQGRAQAVDDERSDVTVVLEPFDFLVNEGLANAQSLSFNDGVTGRQVSAMPDGRFMAVWEDDCPLERCDLIGRIFGPDGRPRVNDTTLSTSDFVVNQANEPTTVPTVVSRGDRGMLAAWMVLENDGENAFSVRANLLTPAGGHQGQDIVVTSTPGDEIAPLGIALDDGRFWVTWSQPRGGGQDSEIRARLYDQDGAPAINPVTDDANSFAVAVSEESHAVLPHGAALPSGEVGVVWQSQASNEQDTTIGARFFGSDGRPRTIAGVQLTNDPLGTSATAPQIAALGDDTFVTVWRRNTAASSELRLALLRSLGTPASNEILVGTVVSTITHPAVAVGLNGGLIVVVWHDRATPSADDDIWMRLVLPSGLPLGPAARVNTVIPRDQSGPSVTALGTNAFVTVWTDDSRAAPDVQASGIRARITYPSLDRTDGVIGARCGRSNDAGCDSNLVCTKGTSDTTSRCHPTCDLPDETTCPEGGVCSLGACLF